jgi:hypothetical protein
MAAVVLMVELAHAARSTTPAHSSSARDGNLVM